jgi:hypothetical protein
LERADGFGPARPLAPGLSQLGEREIERERASGSESEKESRPPPPLWHALEHRPVSRRCLSRRAPRETTDPAVTWSSQPELRFSENKQRVPKNQIEVTGRGW